MCVNMIAENVFASGVWPLLSNLVDPDLGKIEAKPKVRKIPLLCFDMYCWQVWRVEGSLKMT